MAYTKIKDLPFFQLCNQLPVATTALSAFTTDETGASPYIYCLLGAAFYRYSASGDSFQLLASPNIAPVTLASLRYTMRRGFHCRVISATSTTVEISGLIGPILDHQTLNILQGTGAGQNALLTYVQDNIYESGVITGTSTSTLVDSTKKWKINQWAGYLVHITYGADATQAKRILYNDATTLYVSDANLMPQNPWENQAFVATAPYALPVNTAGSQTNYAIRTQTFSVPAWTTIPDNTSFATTITGGIYLFSSAAAAPYFTLQYYDVVADNWVTKTCPQSLIGAAFGTDCSLERTAKVNGPYKSGKVTSATNKTFTDTSKSLITDQYRNFRVLIVSGTGAGQDRRIVCNVGGTFTLARNWNVNPDVTSNYELWPDFDRLYLVGNGAAAMYAYSPSSDYWMQGQTFYDGITSNISCTMIGWNPLGVTTGARIAAGVTGINPVPTAPGSGYLVGDVLTCSVGGTGAKVLVTGINVTGGVTGIELMAAGTATGFAIGTGKTTSGGTGTLCTIEITSIGPTCLVTLATNHWFKTGQPVTFAGCTDALYNAQFTILCVGGITAFDISVSATASMVAANSQGTTVIVDPTVNWAVNEHVGRLVQLCVTGLTPTSQFRMITSNTATTLTVQSITAGVNGTSKYTIYDSKIFGCAELRRATAKKGYGHATGGSLTSLIDTSKNWDINQFAGHSMKIEAGTGYGTIVTVTSNTATTLNYSSAGFTPDASTHYEIRETWGQMTGATTTSITDTAKTWGVNQFAGKRVRVTGGTAPGQESAITSNTATALTLTSTLTLMDTTSTYAILEIAPRGAGVEMQFVFGVSNVANQAEFMLLPRGGNTNGIDLYNVTTEKFNEVGMFFSPQQELFTTGTMYAYDGGDYLYIHNLGRILRYNLKTNQVDNGFQLSGTQGAALIGNRMEIVVDSAGNDYLYIAQHSGTLLWRVALFDL